MLQYSLFASILVTTSLGIAACSLLFQNNNLAQASSQNFSGGGAKTIYESLTGIYDRAHNSVVEITTWFPGQQSFGKGSGFVLDKFIVTNAHVVLKSGKIKTVDVSFSDRSSYEAKVLGTDTLTDLAVLSLPPEANDKLLSLTLGNSSSLKIGEPVVAIGSPLGYTSSMSYGIVSALGRLSISVFYNPFISQPGEQAPPTSSLTNPDMIQTDTAINHGNSGGPLLNLKGEVIGVSDLGLSGERTPGAQGLNFAIPSNTVKKVLPSLISEGHFDHPWLGVSGTELLAPIGRELGISQTGGFLVVSVTPGSPAEKAGVRGGYQDAEIQGQHYTLGGDIIIGIDGKPVQNINDILVHVLRNKQVGDNVELSMVRNGQVLNLSVALEALPSEFKPMM